jgi:hypothetical protein
LEEAFFLIKKSKVKVEVEKKNEIIIVTLYLLIGHIQLDLQLDLDICPYVQLDYLDTFKSNDIQLINWTTGHMSIWKLFKCPILGIGHCPNPTLVVITNPDRSVSLD